MEKSEKFGFNLPNRDGDDLADINEITQNFQLIEEKIPSNDDLEEAKDEAIQEATKNLILNYIEYEITEGNEVNILRCDPSIEGDYIIPEKIEGCLVTSICRNFSATSQYGFLDCVNLNSIVIPDTVELIGSNAFNNCVSLEKVHIGNGVRKIGSSAFSACSALKSVYLPNVETIETGAFERCINLEAVTVGKGLVVVSLLSFSETNLKDVYYEGSQDEWSDVVFESQNDIILNAKVHFNYDPTLTTKGYVDEALSAVLPNNLELIAEGELPENAAAISITTDKNGNALNLVDNITIYMYSPACESEMEAHAITIDFDDFLLAQIANSVGYTTERFSKAFCFYSGWSWEMFVSSATATSATSTFQNRFRTPLANSGATPKNISNIKIYSYIGKPFPKGFKYQVYGRRAKQ